MTDYSLPHAAMDLSGQTALVTGPQRVSAGRGYMKNHKFSKVCGVFD